MTIEESTAVMLQDSQETENTEAEPSLTVTQEETAKDDENDEQVSSSSSSEDEVEQESTDAIAVSYPDTQVTYSIETTAQPKGQINRKQNKQAPSRPSSAKSNNENQPLKRGQRARLKKIKEKYKDQDEEDRALRMQLLASAGTESKRKQKEKEKEKEKQRQRQNQGKQKNQNASTKPQPKPVASAVGVAEEDEPDQQEDEEEKAKRLSEDARLLSTLTGQPTIEDPLTNVIGVCAPWVTLNNYKYKVKILPGGMGKKGKSKLLS